MKLERKNMSGGGAAMTQPQARKSKRSLRRITLMNGAVCWDSVITSKLVTNYD